MGRVHRGRRRLRRSAAAATTAIAMLALAGCGGDDGDESRPIPHQEFLSRPDLKPPAVEITEGPAWSARRDAADEYIFLSPNYGTPTPQDGSLILDAAGELVWMRPASDEDPDDDPFDLRVQQYDGRDVLTVYEGPSEGGHGHGEVTVLDGSYEQIARVTTGGSLGPDEADLHETTITEDGTMLLAAYVPTEADLTEVGGPADGHVEDAVIQEVDIATGEVVFEWSALDHVPVTETMVDYGAEREEVAEEAEDDEDPAVLGSAEEPFDYFHINSVTVDDDGSLLVSARHTHAVYRLDRSTGAVDWTLGGSSSDFSLDEDAVFSWQHDAQRAPDGTLTLFDNHAHGGDADESSRGLRLALDEEAMTAEVAAEYRPPEERVSSAMANAQQLDDGGMLIGWGSRPHYSEYTADGELIYDVCHGDECLDGDYDGGGGSYRAYALEWQGRPTTDPDAVLTEEGGESAVHVSWNGATEVAEWRLTAGGDGAATVARDGFETTIPVPDGGAEAESLRIEALDDAGEVLGGTTPSESAEED